MLVGSAKFWTRHVKELVASGTGSCSRAPEGVKIGLPGGMEVTVYGKLADQVWGVFLRK